MLNQYNKLAHFCPLSPTFIFKCVFVIPSSSEVSPSLDLMIFMALSSSMLKESNQAIKTQREQNTQKISQALLVGVRACKSA